MNFPSNYFGKENETKCPQIKDGVKNMNGNTSSNYSTD